LPRRSEVKAGEEALVSKTESRTPTRCAGATARREETRIPNFNPLSRRINRVAQLYAASSFHILAPFAPFCGSKSDGVFPLYFLQ
jgi:hypothetical protein